MRWLGHWRKRWLGGVIVIVLALAPNLFDDDEDDYDNDNNDYDDDNNDDDNDGEDDDNEDDNDDDDNDDDDAFVSPLPPSPSLQKRWLLSTCE